MSAVLNQLSSNLDHPDWLFSPRLTVEIAENAGHFVHFEQLVAANDRLKAFFTSVKA